MQTLKRFFIFALTLTLVFALFSCGECKHADEDGDGICDKCDEVISEEKKIEDVNLIENGEVKFQIVVEKDASAEVSAAVDSVIANFERLGAALNRVDDDSSTSADVEVLIGNVTSRGEQYILDKHSLGYDGYVIKIIGKKILITAGSDETLVLAIEEFADNILCIDAETETMPTSRVMTEEDMVENTPDGYRITSFKINGQDIAAYTIAADLSSAPHADAAKAIQQSIYKRTGHYLEIVAIDKADKSIIVKLAEKSDLEANGFKVSVNDKNQLLVECAYQNKFFEGVQAFLAEHIELASGDVNLVGTVYDNFEANIIYYDEMGAVGDGKTDDYEAIYNAHKTANEFGQTVKATPGKTYRIEKSIINGVAASIPIRTSTVWTGAKIIIDDRQITTTVNREWNLPAFKVESDYEVIDVTDPEIIKSILDAGLNRKTTKIDLGDAFNYKLMLVPYNAQHGIYRRKGYSAFAGTSMHEVIILDAEGNVDPTTPVMWDYTSLTSLSIYRIDGVTPITLEGGEFTTRVSQQNCLSEENGVQTLSQMYIDRGIVISRPNTTVKGLVHLLSDEPQYKDQYNSSGVAIYVANSYQGFYKAINTANVLFEDCVVTGHRCYPRPSAVGGGTQGTYDISGRMVANLTFKGCTQSNFWVSVDPETGHITACPEGTPGALPSMEYHPVVLEKYKKSNRMHWGVGGTNICKNLEYINSTISRYDAHEGVYNGKVIGSTVNAMSLTGGGTMIIENTRTFTANANRVFTNREDYGSIWDGTVYLNNVKAYVDVEQFGNISVLERSYKNWYYGYQVVVPNIVINDVYFYDVKSYDGSTPYDPETSYAAVPNTTPIYLYDSTTVKATDKNHLPETDSSPFYSYEDKDKDGYVDVPDLDGDGTYENCDGKNGRPLIEMPSEQDFASGIKQSAGIRDTNSYLNFNITRPPEYVKIVSNKAGYKFYIPNTAKSGTISNGAQYDVDVRPEYNGQMGYYGIEENWKGYYGSTKFYYGPGENDYYEGPPSASEKITDDATKGWYDWYVFY